MEKWRIRWGARLAARMREMRNTQFYLGTPNGMRPLL
jgi:hypothetical protein